MKKLFFILIVGVFAFLVGGFIFSKIDKNQTPPSSISQNQPSIKSLPNLTFKDYGGNAVPLSRFTGKPLVINSWAAWCTFCRTELPDFVKAQKELGDTVVIIAINRAEQPNVSKQYIDSLGITDDLIFLLDPQDAFYKAIGGFVMPETVFVDKKGRVLDHKKGVMDFDEIKARIQKIL